MFNSPEIVENKEYDHKADIWSFGCILYELLVLTPAFSGSNPLQLAKKVHFN
jgi:serine/threonine protein kinase